MRLRISFAKNDLMRFTGHLDLHRAWERIFRRAALPLAYTQGFSPHPRINLASALPLGFTSEAELVDVWLEEELPLDEIARSLTRAIPPGIQIIEIQSIIERLPSLQSSLESSEFVVTFLEETPELREQVQRLMEANSLPRTRRNKPYDLRPLIEALEVLPATEEGYPCLRMLLSAREGATGRPEEVLDCMGIPVEECRVHRTALFFDRGF
jgi:radical SAM-linked protein